MRRYGQLEIELTDKLRTCSSAMKFVGNAQKQETGRRLNNRVEIFHFIFFLDGGNGACSASGKCFVYRYLQLFNLPSVAVSTRNTLYNGDHFTLTRWAAVSECHRFCSR
ncbi:hypothetical protein C1J03_21770 [Sulfitobacter sp. SK012]|nr:hypothetical protein C1J03_21770 [Sulfitobacter sp. SK012]